MLVLVGLPTVFPKLIKSRTYAERMFRVIALDNLNPADCRQAVMKPLHNQSLPTKKFFRAISEQIGVITQGYPYFIQFWCRELYDHIISAQPAIDKQPGDILERIAHKLDMDFFEGRWARLTDRQRDLLVVIASLKNSSREFTVQEIAEASKSTGKAFSGSHVSQMLNMLFDKGMVFKNRHGKYTLAVPLLDAYIRRRVA